MDEFCRGRSSLTLCSLFASGSGVHRFESSLEFCPLFIAISSGLLVIAESKIINFKYFQNFEIQFFQLVGWGELASFKAFATCST